jgi:hypothetical protein
MDQSTRLKLEDTLSEGEEERRAGGGLLQCRGDTQSSSSANRLKQLQTNEGMIVALRLVKNRPDRLLHRYHLDDIACWSVGR